MIPLYGFLEKDSLGLLIMAYEEDTVKDLIQKTQQAAIVRVQPQANMQLTYKGKILLPEQTVKEVQFKPLDHFFVTKSNPYV